MLGTANGAGSAKPAIPGLHRHEVFFSLCPCFCGRMPPHRGPIWRGESAEESPQEAAHDARPFAACTGTYIQRTRSRLAHPQGRMPGGRAIWGVFLWLLSLHKQRE